MKQEQLDRIRRLEPLTGAARFMKRIVYADDAQIDACILYFASTHIVSELNTIGRLLVTSPEPGAGKTTVLDAAAMMCASPWMTEPTKWALQGRFKGPDRPTAILDEISTYFGLNGQRGRSNPIYKPIVEGYRRSATFSVQVDGAPQEFSCFCATIMAGLKNAVPPDLRTRCIPIIMKSAPDSVLPLLEDSLDEGVEADGKRIGEQMHSWSAMFRDEAGTWAREAARKHPRLNGRKLQVWGGMYAVAKAAGSAWEARFVQAFVEIALDRSERPVLSPEDQVLMDAGHYLDSRGITGTGDDRYLLSADLLRYLRSLDDNIYTMKTDSQIARLMNAGLGRAVVLTLADRRTARGWRAVAVTAAFTALAASLAPVTPEEEPDEYEDFFDVAEEEQQQETEGQVNAA
jgi:Protein of unknown function (DUF3631)